VVASVVVVVERPHPKREPREVNLGSPMGPVSTWCLVSGRRFRRVHTDKAVSTG
jgi:hypothetical protein